MVEAVLRAAGPYSLRLTAGTSTWTARLAGERWASAQQLQDGRVIVRASDELAVDEARFMLALDDDTSEFHRRFARDPLLGPTVQRLRGMRTRRKATVTHAVIRAVAGQLIQASKALAIERAIIRGCGEDPPTREALAGLSPARLTGYGLAASRAATLARLARGLDLEGLRRKPDALARLERERGVGPWTVGVVALQGLGRYDAGLVDDLASREAPRLAAPAVARARRDRRAPRAVRRVAGARERLSPAGLQARTRAGREHGSGTARALVGTARRLRTGRRLLRMVDARKIAILGAGRIGESLISGLLSSGWRESSEVSATTRRAERVADLRERYGVEATLSNHDAVAGAALVVIAVKPQDIDGLLGEIGTLILPEQTVLSVAAAIPTARIESRLSDGVPVVRAMPNTPSTVHEGIAGLCAGAHAGDEHLDLAEEALAHLGAVVRVPEQAMDAITAVSGSGPAYFALLAEAMIEAGILLGLSREISTQLVVQTMLGTAKQLRDEKMHPVELREMVTSPGGTTIAAIRELEIAGVRAAFLNAIQAAMVRARELACRRPVVSSEGAAT